MLRAPRRARASQSSVPAPRRGGSSTTTSTPSPESSAPSTAWPASPWTTRTSMPARLWARSATAASPASTAVTMPPSAARPRVNSPTPANSSSTASPGATAAAWRTRRSRSAAPWGPVWKKLPADGAVTISVEGFDFRVSAGSFFQTGPQGAALLLRLVRQAAAVAPGDAVLELFAGVGLFTRGLAADGGMVTAVEAGDAAVAGFNGGDHAPVSYTHLTLPTIYSV